MRLALEDVCGCAMGLRGVLRPRTCTKDTRRQNTVPTLLTRTRPLHVACEAWLRQRVEASDLQCSLALTHLQKPLYQVGRKAGNIADHASEASKIR